MEAGTAPHARADRTLVLGDFSNLAYRVSPAVSMAPYPMVRRALLRARDVARSVGASDLAFAFDPDPAPSPNFAGPPEEARTPMARGLLRGLGYPCYQEPGLSADDLLIALARAAERAGFGRVVIASHDMDLVAAVSARTSLVRPIGAKGVFLRFDTWDAARIRAKLGVEPERLADLRVLGCRPYLGTTHAILDGRSSRRLLAEHGSLEGLYANLATVEPAGLRLRLAGQEAFARERLAAIRATETRRVEFHPDAGRLGAPTPAAVDAGLAGLGRGELLEASDAPRLAVLSASLAGQEFAAMPRYRVEVRMLALATGVEWLSRQEVEAADEVAAGEMAGLRASRGHSRSIPRAVTKVVELPPPRVRPDAR